MRLGGAIRILRYALRAPQDAGTVKLEWPILNHALDMVQISLTVVVCFCGAAKPRHTNKL
jgi:hypothetical protein